MLDQINEEVNIGVSRVHALMCAAELLVLLLLGDSGQ